MKKYKELIILLTGFFLIFGAIVLNYFVNETWTYFIKIGGSCLCLISSIMLIVKSRKNKVK